LVTPVATDFERPNGLCFSPDEKHLYIADDARRHIRRFEVTDGGELEGGEVFAEIDPGVPDGMRCDAAGRLFTTAGDGVHVFDADGTRLGKILVLQTPANCGFGGADGKTLFITARTGLYAVDLKTSAATRPAHRQP
jgi:gluconolactonase